MLKLIQNGLTKTNLSTNIFKPQRYLSILPIQTEVPASEKQIPDQQKDDAPIEMENPFEKEKQKCILCEMKITPNYKNVRLLSQFQSPYTGRIYGRHITGLCKKRQEQVENAIVRAQNCALMPSYHKDVKYLNEPKLFDPERPIRPHKY